MILEEILNVTNNEFKIATGIYEGMFERLNFTMNVANYSKHLLSEEVRNSEVTHIDFVNHEVYIKMS